MYRLINQNAAAVLSELDRLKIPEYLRLRAGMSFVDVAVDMDFQLRYRSYWRMNVGRFGPAFYKRYFALLGDCQHRNSADVRQAIQVLSDIGVESRGLQFSFATKLVHMIDPRLPVYDSYVAAFYFYAPASSKTTPAKRIDDLVEFYEFLREEYARVLRDGLLREALQGFKSRVTTGDSIPDERIIDWLLWGWVSYLRSGAQQSGRALFA